MCGRRSAIYTGSDAEWLRYGTKECTITFLNPASALQPAIEMAQQKTIELMRQNGKCSTRSGKSLPPCCERKRSGEAGCSGLESENKPYYRAPDGWFSFDGFDNIAVASLDIAFFGDSEPPPRSSSLARRHADALGWHTCPVGPGEGNECVASEILRAYTGHHEHRDRSIVNAAIGVHDRSEATRGGQPSSLPSFRRECHGRWGNAVSTSSGVRMTEVPGIWARCGSTSRRGEEAWHRPAGVP